MELDDAGWHDARRAVSAERHDLQADGLCLGRGMEEGAWDRAVEQARVGEPVTDVEALTLDGLVKCAQGKLPKSKVFAPFTQLKRLSIANVGLSSLADFPSLPHLERLILSDNRIAAGLEHLVYAGLKSLRELDLSNNKIQSVEDLKPLAQLKLESLDLYECPVTRSADYRAKVFGMMKSLRFLDKTDVTGNERPESDEEEEEEEEEEDVDDLNGDGAEVDGDEEEGVEGDSKGPAVHEEDDDDGEEDEERDDDGEDNEELEDEEEDEGGSYQEEVVVAATSRVVVQGHVNNEHGSDEEEVEDEEDDNVEVQDIEEESEEEEVGDEDDEDAVVDEEEEEDDEEPVSGAHVSTEGELDVQENEEDEEDENGELGEDEEDDEVEDDAVDNDEGEEEVEEEDDEEEEEYGTKYLVQPIGQPEEDEGASDFEPGDDDDEEDEDFEDEEDDEDPVKEPVGLKDNRKRMREETGEKEERPAKH
jgi:acidic leucine-rich nuclear phosphoprotein 32 family protein B